MGKQDEVVSGCIEKKNKTKRINELEHSQHSIGTTKKSKSCVFRQLKESIHDRASKIDLVLFCFVFLFDILYNMICSVVFSALCAYVNILNFNHHFHIHREVYIVYAHTHDIRHTYESSLSIQYRTVLDKKNTRVFCFLHVCASV